MITVGEIWNVVKPLDGTSYSSREELDNAFLPVFSPVQPAMPGQSFRDFVDLLIRKSWILNNSRGYTVVLPRLVDHNETHVVPAPPPAIQVRDIMTKLSKPELTYREIAIMVGLNTEPYESDEPDSDFDSLIARGLVEHVAERTPEERAVVEGELATAKQALYAAVASNDFGRAHELLHDCEDIASGGMVYRLTAVGQSLMDGQPDSKFLSL